MTPLESTWTEEPLSNCCLRFRIASVSLCVFLLYVCALLHVVRRFCFQLIPAEVQLGLERFFIVGFTLCLLFLVAVGLSIATEAYFKATTGELPQELDNFIVQVMLCMRVYPLSALLGVFPFDRVIILNNVSIIHPWLIENGVRRANDKVRDRQLNSAVILFSPHPPMVDT